MIPHNIDDMDRILLCSRPSQKAIWYTRMCAFGNHFRVEDLQSALLQTYDSGIASIFEMPNVDSQFEVSLNYVRVLEGYNEVGLWSIAYSNNYFLMRMIEKGRQSHKSSLRAG